MRTLVVWATALLTITGLAILVFRLVAFAGTADRVAVLAHIWLGVGYLVVFPLYAWDHVSKNRRWLTVLRGLTVSGLTQLTCGALLLLTGIVLLAFSGALQGGLRTLHQALTYPLVGALIWHYLSPKCWRGAARSAQETSSQTPDT
jgi:hypothetical protein